MGEMSGIAFSSIPMIRPNQTESAVFDSCMSSVISKVRFRIVDILRQMYCYTLNMSGEDFLN